LGRRQAIYLGGLLPACGGGLFCPAVIFGADGGPWAGPRGAANFSSALEKLGPAFRRNPIAGLHRDSGGAKIIGPGQKRTPRPFLRAPPARRKSSPGVVGRPQRAYRRIGTSAPSREQARDARPAKEQAARGEACFSVFARLSTDRFPFRKAPAVADRTGGAHPLVSFRLLPNRQQPIPPSRPQKRV